MSESKRYAIIGAAGYITPKHLRAIKDTGGELVAAYDPNDNVGVLDSYFPKTAFFVEFERFDRYLEKLKRQNGGLDYISICSPNYLHDSHIRFGLRLGCDVICEKPLVLNVWNAISLLEVEREYGKEISNILQMRLHPRITQLKFFLENQDPNKIFDLDLTYITSRGNWYYTSWKGDIAKSGGLATNIGIHFFDMLIWLFGDVIENIVHLNTHDRVSGYLILKKARVRWFLSINHETLPENTGQSDLFVYRSLLLDGNEISFNEGFADLHVESYREILSGNGFHIKDVLPAIQLVSEIRNQIPIGLKGNVHPFAYKPLSKHPFKHEP